jgi:hypothetical protein
MGLAQPQSDAWLDHGRTYEFSQRVTNLVLQLGDGDEHVRLVKKDFEAFSRPFEGLELGCWSLRNLLWLEDFDDSARINAC